MTNEHQHNLVCENCGNEANMIIKEEDAISTEQGEIGKPKRRVMVCKACGNEAEMILEEIEME